MFTIESSNHSSTAAHLEAFRRMTIQFVNDTNFVISDQHKTNSKHPACKSVGNTTHRSIFCNSWIPWISRAPGESWAAYICSEPSERISDKWHPDGSHRISNAELPNGSHRISDAELADGSLRIPGWGRSNGSRR